MVEITAITNAISLLTRLKTISANIRDAEFKNVLADLSIELAEVKMKMASLMNENLELQNRIKELESVEGDPCPKCHKRGWQIEKSQKHPSRSLGLVGFLLRTYKCSFCDFTEEKMISPKE
jgi:hypothetical protein